MRETFEEVATVQRARGLVLSALHADSNAVASHVSTFGVRPTSSSPGYQYLRGHPPGTP